MTACLSPPESSEPDVAINPLPVADAAPVAYSRLNIKRVTHRTAHRWSGETAGLIIALLETGLTDLPSILPLVEGAPVAPGWENPLFDHARNWRLHLEFDYETDEDVHIFAKICPEPGNCSGAHARVSRKSPTEGVSKLLVRISEVLGVTAADGIVEGWSKPISEDDYAILMLGRAAGQLYGYIPAPAPRTIGNRREDPSERAVYIDPTMLLGYWVRARRELTEGNPKEALASLTRADEEGGYRPYLRITKAAAFERLEEWKQAASVWESLAPESGPDLRFAVRQAETWAKGSSPQAALKLIESLPDDIRSHADICRLRVTASENAGIKAGYEARLEAWARAAPTDPEPLRRLIAQGLRNDQKNEVRSRLRELEARGATAEAQAMAIAMDNELRHYDSAFKEAEDLGLSVLAQQIRARRRLERGGRIHAFALAKTNSPGAMIAAARVLLGESPIRALGLANRLLKKDPWFPEALAVKVQALRLLKDEAAAQDSLERLALADPAFNLESLTSTLKK
jgi:hypothetical protein